jgi:hypothetical protein
MMTQGNASGLMMGRRDFMRSSSLVAGGLVLTPGLLARMNEERPFLVNSPLNARTTIQIIITGTVHEEAWEGSCRHGKLENLSYEAEMNGLARRLERVKEEVSAMEIPRGIELLEPISMYSYVEKGNPAIMFSEKQLESLYEEDHKVDLYVVTHMYPGVKIAERYKKPVAIMQGAGWAVDMPARLRYMGLEGYHVHDYGELLDLGTLLNARKAFANTKMLYVTNFPYQYPWGCTSSAVVNMDQIKKHYGLDYKFVDYEEFFADMDALVKDKKIAKMRKEAGQELLRNANSSNMTLQDIEKSLDFYYATLSSMEKYGCNAFTIECHELCSSLNPWMRKFTPCLTHALLKDTGFPAACEGDVNALMAMMIEMYVSGKSVYMGNPFFDFENNTLRLKHSNCSLKMNGLEAEDTSYDIHSFAESGFGATLRHDFKLYKGNTCTVSRFDPSGMKILVTKGEVITGIGNEGFGCEQSVSLKIPDCQEFWRSSQNYGHHFSLVYGDYTREIRDLGDMMNFEVKLIS